MRAAGIHSTQVGKIGVGKLVRASTGKRSKEGHGNERVMVWDQEEKSRISFGQQIEVKRWSYM